MKTKSQKYRCFETLFKTRMDFKFIRIQKLFSILNKPEKWQVIEFVNPNSMYHNHIVGAILINKLFYQSALDILDKNKKVLINGDFFEVTYYYHYLRSHHYRVYLIKNKPKFQTYKNIRS